MKTIGRHLIAEFYHCNPSMLDNLEGITKAMREAAVEVGATIVGDTFHKFAPHGVSGSVVIAESHLSIHTWPENGYVSVDIYTCGGLDPKLGFLHLAKRLEAREYRVQEILRGLPEDLESESFGPDDVQIITQTSPLQAVS